MICFKNVSFRYSGGRESLKNINLDVDEGEVLLICGPSGCGKSTLVRCINGLVPHFYKGNMTGSVNVCGIDVSKSTLRNISKSVGTVFQNPRSQFFNVDTTSEIAFGCENLCLPPEEIEERINSVVNKHDLRSLMDRNIFKLSGGEKQKIACASIAVEPVKVVILDEPSANLDYKGICELQKMIESWKKERRTIVIAEHRISYLLPYITRAALMESGEIIREMTAEEMRGFSEDDLHRLGLRAEEMQDPGMIEIKADEGSDHGENLVLHNMKYSYRGGRTVLDIPQMKIPKGEIVGIVGENGAGKSTFLRCLCGVERRCRA
nr:ABC transporter ATP-binding protein [Lachnospiraceae bacterium]